MKNVDTAALKKLDKVVRLKQIILKKVDNEYSNKKVNIDNFQKLITESSIKALDNLIKDLKKRELTNKLNHLV